MRESLNRKLSWPIDPDRPARRAELDDCMISDVLIEAIGQLLEDCSMSWLKVDLDNMSNCIPIRGCGNPRDACRIEIDHSIKSILIPGVQRRSQWPRKWCYRARECVAQNVRWPGRLISCHFRVWMRSGTPRSKINRNKMQILICL